MYRDQVISTENVRKQIKENSRPKMSTYSGLTVYYF